MPPRPVGAYDSRVSDIAFSGSVPAGYHTHLRSLLFEPYARELASRLPARRPLDVLETACGTGILTLRLAETLDGEGTLHATDINDDMLVVARDHLGSRAGAVSLATADMVDLPSADGAFDVVVCQFGLMFAPEPGLALREARRVLRDGGLLLLSTWAELADNPAPHAAHTVVLDEFPDDPPRFYETPFGMADPERLASLLADSGFGEIEVEIVAKTGYAPSASEAALGLVSGNPIADAIRARDPSRLEPVRERIAERLTTLFGDGELHIPLRAIVASGAC